VKTGFGEQLILNWKWAGVALKQIKTQERNKKFLIIVLGRKS